MNARRAAKNASHVRVTAAQTLLEAAGRQGRCQRGLIFRPDARNDRDVQVVLALDELVDTPDAAAGFARDVADRGGRVADAGEHALGGGDQVGAVGFDPPRAPFL